MKYDRIDAQLWAHNRQRFSARMMDNSIAIFNSNDEVPRSADSYHTWRQNPDLLHLTGIDQERTILVLAPNHPNEKMREVLFIRRSNKHLAIWEGHKFTVEEAREVSGIQNVKYSDQFEDILPAMLFMVDNCYLNMNEHGRMSSNVPDKDIRFAREMKNTYPLHHFHRAAPIMHDIRAIKHDIEIDLMQTAVNITGKAFDRVMKFVKPGVFEYEVEAEIVHEFLRSRANGTAYDSIVASGNNANVLHYVDNNQECKDGDLLLMDFGANYANYAADLSRTIPVNGRFTDRQRAVYNAVLRVMRQATDMLRPGTLIEQYHKEVGKMMEGELIDLGLLNKDEVAKQNPASPLYKKYFMHGTSHFLGIDVHDVGNRRKPIEAGMVFTCEPGLYIPEEGFGIRIENDILVTNDKPIDLMDVAGVPIEAEHIEEVMNAAKLVS